MISSTELLESVISSVFSCTNNADQSRNNQWILEFVERDEAWTAAIQVINKNIQSIEVGSSGYVCFFAANIIYTKIKKHWESLSSSQQVDIINAFNVILNYILSRNLSCSKAFLDRFLLCYICMAMKGGVDGIKAYITTASQLININDITLNNIPISSSIGLDMLVILPLELESSDISNKTRENITVLLVETVENVLKLCNDMSIGAISALPSEIQTLIQSTVPSPILSQAGDINSTNYGLVVIYIFKLIKAWLQYGISLSKMFHEHSNLINTVLITLHTGGNWSLSSTQNKHLILKECCVVLHDIVTVQDYPVVQTVNNQSILFLLQHIVQSIPSFGYYFVYENIIMDNEVENTAYEICNCLVAVIVSQLSFLAASSTFNLDFFTLLLSLASIQPRKIAMLTFDVWIAIQDIPITERHAYLVQDVFSQLLNVVFVQCIYPIDYDHENDDDFDLYRDNKSGIQEIILTCAYSLQDKFYQHLHTYLVSNNVFQVDSAGGSTSTGMSLSSSWRFIEVVLYSLVLASDAVKATLRSENSQYCYQFIHFILQFTLTNLDSGSVSLFPHLRTIICQFLGSLVYMMTLSSVSHINPSLVLPEYYFPALKFSFFSLFPSDNISESNHALYAAAGKTVYQLLIHGSTILTTSISADNTNGMLINEIVTTASTLLPLQSKRINSNDADETFNVDIQQPYLQLIEGLTRVIVTLPIGAGKQLLSTLVEPLLSDLQRCVLDKQYLDRNDHRQIENSLVYVSKVIRFCDLPTDPSTGDHLLSALLSRFWDVITVLESHDRFLINPKIVASIFDLYTRMLHSVGPIMLPYLPHITSSIVNIFSAKGQASASSLLCAGNIIELLMNKGNEEDEFSFKILSSLTQVLFSSTQYGTTVASTTTVWGYEVDCIEEYFNFVHKFLRFYPYIITNNGDDNSRLLQIVEIMLQAMNTCKEKGPLRVILQVIQALFMPNIPTNIYLSQLIHYGQKITSSIFYAIDGGITSVLLPNLVDTLYSIVKGCDEAYKQQCHDWCLVIMEDQVMKSINIEMKQRILHHMFRFAASNTNDGKKYFKLLLHDTSKICCGELASDALLAYDNM